MSKSGKNRRSRAILALAAAASLSAMAVATHASASTTFTLVSASMDTDFYANITGFGEAYASPVTFQISGYPGNAAETSLFGFCFDIYHDMYLGNLGYTYTTNQPSGGGLVPNSPQTLANGGNPSNPLDPLNQISDITNLVDTGFILHSNETSANYADTEARLAAIQVAIWDAEQPGIVTSISAATGAENTAFQNYLTYYTSGAYHTLADANDKVFTISDTIHQSFAIGWPIAGVPEPATWAMMISGFFGVGSLVRRQRKAAVAAA